MVRELGISRALPVLMPTFPFLALPALVLYVRVIVFFLKAKDVQGQAQGVVLHCKIERHAQIIEIAAMVEMLTSSGQVIARGTYRLC